MSMNFYPVEILNLPQILDMKSNGLKMFAIFGMLAVALGAFGAHGLKSKVPESILEAYKTGVLYHSIHTLVIGIIAIAGQLGYIQKSHRIINVFALGIILFSGSLYGIAFANVFQMNTSIIGPITPIGGIVLILAWVFTFLNVKKSDLGV